MPVWAAFLISIHAPPRGATALKWTDTLAIKLFQFTPLREGRLRSGAGKPLDITFQFTPLREGRQSVRALENPLTLHFNSRPSARGDACRAAQRKDRRYFNSRPSARGDVIVPSTARYCGLFQFTPLREGRLRGFKRPQWRLTYFNSRPSARGDAEDFGAFISMILFQFTPLREGRPKSGRA